MSVFVYFILIIFIPNYPTCFCNIFKTLLFNHIIKFYNINIILTPKHEKPITNYIFYDFLSVNVPHYVMRIQKLFMKFMQCDYIILYIVVG
jgi:hypothetical protein